MGDSFLQGTQLFSAAKLRQATALMDRWCGPVAVVACASHHKEKWSDFFEVMLNLQSYKDGLDADLTHTFDLRQKESSSFLSMPLIEK